MATPIGNKGDNRSYNAAEDAFTSEGGYVAQEPGRHYHYIGYRYYRFAAAPNYEYPRPRKHGLGHRKPSALTGYVMRKFARPQYGRKPA